MVKRIMTIALLAVFAVSAFLPNAIAYDKQKQKACYGKKSLNEKVLKKAYFFLKNADEIGLSDDQVMNVKEIKVAAKKEMIRKDADIELLKIDIKSKLYSDNINLDEINKLIDQKYKLKNEKAKYLVAKYAELKGMLTDEQMEKAIEIWKNCDKQCKR